VHAASNCAASLKLFRLAYQKDPRISSLPLPLPVLLIVIPEEPALSEAEGGPASVLAHPKQVHPLTTIATLFTTS